MDKFYCIDYGDYILMPSRLNPVKRQALAIEAMSRTKSDIKLLIVGAADSVSEAERLHSLVKDCNLESRIQFLDYVSQEEKFELYANARAVLFIPYDEDYGYITLEGMSSSKALITTTNSGGPLEFIENGKTGFIVEPNPDDLSAAIDEIADSVSLAMQMGNASKQHLTEMDISWDNVVRKLTGDP